MAIDHRPPLLRLRLLTKMKKTGKTEKTEKAEKGEKGELGMGWKAGKTGTRMTSTWRISAPEKPLLEGGRTRLRWEGHHPRSLLSPCPRPMIMPQELAEDVLAEETVSVG